MAQILLDHVEKAYAGGVKAVDDLSLDIKDGEFMVFVGPSGCGKSTALRSIAGLEEITGGTIIDRRPGGQRPAAEGPGHRDGVPELRPVPAHDRRAEPGLRPAAAQDAQGRRSSGGWTRPPRCSAWSPTSKRKPAALSGGQRQRVAMGRAIVREPQAFLMDEPLSNLDAKLRVSMRASLNQLHERLGVTTVYVTHDQVEAMTLGRPRLRAAGRAAAAGRHPADPVRVAGQPVRGRVHRLPRDELRERASWSATTAPAVTFAGYKLPVPADVLENKPGLADYLGKQVILGIRPSDFEDATSATPAARMMRVTAGVTEELGSEIMVIFTIDAPHGRARQPGRRRRRWRRRG